MKKLNIPLMLFVGALSLSALAQQAPIPPEPIKPPIPPTAPKPADMEKMQRDLEKARQRLEAAARDVAEHSAQIYQEHIPQLQRFRIEQFGNSKGAVLGVHIEESKDQNENRVDGVDVVGVTPGGPAEAAGLQSGDRIIALNGESLRWQADQSPAQQLLKVMAVVEPEQAVTVDYVRDGESNSVIVNTKKLNHHQFFANSDDFDFDFDFQLGDQHQQALKDKVIVLNNGIKSLYSRYKRPWHELELMALTPKLGSYFNTDKGILIVSTGDNVDLKLEEGDVIVSIDGRVPSDPSHTIRILNSYSPGETVTFEILRERRKKSVEYVIKEMNQDVGLQWFDNGSEGVRVIPIPSDNHTKKIRLEKEESI